MINEFKKFAFKGNVIDMAVGVIIGGAFGKIVTSLVNDILMPFIGILVGGINFSTLKWIVVPATEANSGLTLNYGVFVQSVIDFFIIAASIFMFITMINRVLIKNKEEAPTPEPKKSDEAVLLEEIRDLLQKQ